MSDLHEKYLELMHAVVDGEASDRERAALKEYLAANPEAENAHAELVKLTDVLSRVQEVELPQDLHENILAALPDRPRRSVVEIASRNSLTRIRIPLIRYGYALAAGLLVGAILTGVAFKSLPQQEKSYVSGTMTPLENPPDYVVVEQIQLAAPDLTGSVELSRSGDNERIIFNLNSERVAQVEVRFDPSLAGIRAFGQEPNNIHSSKARVGSILFQSQGKQRSVVILAGDKRAQATLNLDFSVEGKLVHQGTFAGRAPAGK